MPYIQTPWPDEFVKYLNRNQHNGKYPPYTCSECKNVMIAIKDGWICLTCGHNQKWMMT